MDKTRLIAGEEECNVRDPRCFAILPAALAGIRCMTVESGSASNPAATSPRTATRSRAQFQTQHL
ncbi:hypothetical protein HFO60_04330 [Rhizobium leguminosarum]|uniref:hypothetical protein n=1 Tax=Rhizobium leguminosarum TaxID=384 RepID=UPI001C941C0F|nr:hypothetical protein [Rhizobium leguminosarum]MBY5539281.1 hypothetical protein [Rhizobium leguminosarum]